MSTLKIIGGIILGYMILMIIYRLGPTVFAMLIAFVVAPILEDLKNFRIKIVEMCKKRFNK